MNHALSACHRDNPQALATSGLLIVQAGLSACHRDIAQALASGLFNLQVDKSCFVRLS